jgi:lactam utilization protein B
MARFKAEQSRARYLLIQIKQPIKSSVSCVRGAVIGHDGSVVALSAQSICFHGDTPGAPNIIATVRTNLKAAGVVARQICDLSQ